MIQMDVREAGDRATLPTEVAREGEEMGEVTTMIGRHESGHVQANSSATAMNMEDAGKHAADYYRLAFLLTGSPDISIDVAVDVAASMADANSLSGASMRAWWRRIVISKALAAIRDELAQSAPRTELAHAHRLEALPRDWSLSPGTTKAQIEEALLIVDVFPRAAVLLTLFEGLPIAEAATLLEADPDLVRKGRGLGLREFIGNLARKIIYSTPSFSSVLKIALATG